MYQQKFVACIKANGKVLRETGESVKIPFGSEYSIYLKNLNTVRAQVKLSVDGVDIGDGTTFIVAPNNFIEIERFIKNGNLSAGNKLKFIERTERIEDARGGIQADDGLIRIEFEFEQQNIPVVNYTYTYIPPPIYPNWYYPPYYWSEVTYKGSTGGFCNQGFTQNIACGGGSTTTSSASASSINTQTQATYSCNNATASPAPYVQMNDAGITVPGSVSNQSFVYTPDILSDGVKHAMIIRLLGKVGEAVVKTPVTVNAKCTTCGRHNKSAAKFCAECGTSLILI